MTETEKNSLIEGVEFALDNGELPSEEDLRLYNILLLARRKENFQIINENSKGIEIVDDRGGYYEDTFYVIAKAHYNGQDLFLLESEKYGDEEPCVIVDQNGNVILENVTNGFEEYEERIEDLIETYHLEKPISFASLSGEHVNIGNYYKLPHNLKFIDKNNKEFELLLGTFDVSDAKLIVKADDSYLYSRKLDEQYTDGLISLTNIKLEDYSFKYLKAVNQKEQERRTDKMSNLHIPRTQDYDFKNSNGPVIGYIEYHNNSGEYYTNYKYDVESYIKELEDEITTPGLNFQTVLSTPKLTQSINEIIHDVYGEIDPTSLDEYTYINDKKPLGYSISVSRIKKEGSDIKGLATLTLGNDFTIKNISIYEKEDGRTFISFPSYKTNDSDDKGQPIYKNICNPITKEFAEELRKNIIDIYKETSETEPKRIGFVAGRATPKTSIHITPYNSADSKVKGYAAVYFENKFIVNNIKICEGKDNSIFVAMPNYRSGDEYKDICHPISKDFRSKLYDEILDAYQATAIESEKKTSPDLRKIASKLTPQPQLLFKEITHEPNL